MPKEFARHCIVSLTSIDEAFSARLTRTDVELIPLNKPPGQTFRIFPKLFEVIRSRQPRIVHTRNIASLETQLIAWIARAPIRIHGEHGWDVNDLHGTNARYQKLRKLFSRLTNHQIALSSRTQQYLVETIGIDTRKVSAIYNGVDTVQFSPAVTPPNVDGWPFQDNNFVVGTVGRLASVKNQKLLCRAFILARQNNESFKQNARLLLVGDGPDRAELEQVIDRASAKTETLFSGECSDVAPFFQNLDLFCLPSLAEGISNSILEAMSCGLPVVATDVGGNAELVQSGVTGEIVASTEPEQLAQALLRYYHDKSLRKAHGLAARQRVLEHFTLLAMSTAYQNVYSHQMKLQSDA